MSEKREEAQPRSIVLRSLHHQFVIQTSKDVLNIKTDDPIRFQALLSRFA
jgi:hypothetical protein